ncbi:DMT family transporter [Halopseudomonas maritima]|uniref:DMT family transporter n=1 Tax=Halopseudomonas maritima TaxID=2918528 RepID=UPI001EEBF0C2|nr:DMT family transporter [Halopseudomonas maritima]UJJ31330.1 DMT family transporter [Halopseudomonas maritima]
MNATLYAATVLIWGTTWIAIAMQSGPVPSAVSVFYRFALASLLLLAVLLVTGRLRRIGPRDHLFCLLQGLCVFSFNFYCFYSANAYINSGLEAVLFSMATLFNAINAVLFFGQRLEARLVRANLLGLVGIVCLFWHDLSAAHLGQDTLIGIGLCLLGTYGFSLGNMISVRHQARRLDVFSTNAYAMGYGAVAMLLLVWWRGDSFALLWTPAYLGALLYLAVIGSVVGFAVYFMLIGRIGAGPAAYATVLFPLIALGMSTLFEGYRWSGMAIVGLALIICGNLLLFHRPRPVVTSPTQAERV